MSFGTNLQYLRKNDNLTQEQFAEKMQVSRQTVSKWESDLSYPETEKIVAICDMFDCDMNELLRGDCTKIGVDRTQAYNSHMNFFTACIAFATFFILFGISVLLFMEYMGTAENIGAAVFLSCVAISVGIYIVSGIKHGEFVKKSKDYKIVPDKQKAQRFNNLFPFLIAFATIMILIGVIWLVVFSSEIDKNEQIGSLYVSGFMLDIAFAVAIYIIAGLQKSKYDLAEFKDMNLSKEEAEKKKKNEKYSGVIMLIATMVFFILGFVFSLWQISWIAFPIGGILCAIVNTILDK
ncbi:MAG: helix-turn-helix domain-containing protein [Acutalibacteraceae bacterium]